MTYLNHIVLILNPFFSFIKILLISLVSFHGNFRRKLKVNYARQYKTLPYFEINSEITNAR